MERNPQLRGSLAREEEADESDSDVASVLNVLHIAKNPPKPHPSPSPQDDTELGLAGLLSLDFAHTPVKSSGVKPEESESESDVMSMSDVTHSEDTVPLSQQGLVQLMNDLPSVLSSPRNKSRKRKRESVSADDDDMQPASLFDLLS